MSKKASTFFSKEEKIRIEKAIVQAEEFSSGEVRVHIDNKCGEEVLESAYNVIAKLKMHQTKLRNGVLFYLAVKSRKFAILGDIGINQKVPKDFWDTIKEEMKDRFLKGDYVGGLEHGILKAGLKLKDHFPYQSEDINELSDEITFG